MDIATLIREIKSLNPTDYRAVRDAVLDVDLDESDWVPTEAHLEIVRQRIRERPEGEVEGDTWEVVKQRLGWES